VTGSTGDVLGTLVSMRGADLATLLLEVARRRAEALDPADVARLAPFSKHLVEVLDASELIAELRRAHLAHERRRIRLLVAPHRVLRRPRRRLEAPRILGRAGPVRACHPRLLPERGLAERATPRSSVDEHIRRRPLPLRA
jgi:hypothetical protein